MGQPRTAARDQTRNQRCAVDFDTPKQGGRARQVQPLTSTWTTAANNVSSAVQVSARRESYGTLVRQADMKERKSPWTSLARARPPSMPRPSS